MTKQDFIDLLIENDIPYDIEERRGVSLVYAYAKKEYALKRSILESIRIYTYLT